MQTQSPPHKRGRSTVGQGSSDGSSPLSDSQDRYEPSSGEELLVVEQKGKQADNKASIQLQS
jgi:hypothetical protein